jgi:transposase
MQQWRAATSAEVEAHVATKSSPGRSPAVRQVKWLLFSPEKRKEKWAQQFADELCRQSKKIDAAQKLVREFHKMLSDRQSSRLQAWLDMARASGVGEFVCFVNGVEQDRKAVEAAFEHEWSQGQVEGQVNRLKLLKRQMHGRAKFDLLRARVWHQG